MTPSRRMRVFHRTTADAAADIRVMGFHDATGPYLTDTEWTGVWVSDVPLDLNEGADGDTLLTIKIPVELFERYEWVEEGKTYREALIPAERLNVCGQVRIVNAEAESRLLVRHAKRQGV